MTSPPTADKARALRDKAALCREAAGRKTNGGRLEDQLLIAVAEALERQAAALDEL